MPKAENATRQNKRRKTEGDYKNRVNVGDGSLYITIYRNQGGVSPYGSTLTNDDAYYYPPQKSILTWYDITSHSLDREIARAVDITLPEHENQIVEDYYG